MATIVLSYIGRNLGNVIGGPIAGSVGAALGALIGANLERRNEDEMGTIRVSPTAEYGTALPIIYGRVRVYGRIIWSAPIKKTRSKIGSSAEYYATFAVALCEGEINAIYKVWANAAILPTSQLQWKIYTGSESQQPDTTIMSFEGSSPAYRGIAYVVIENLPIGPFGNRIPELSFEVERIVETNDACKKITALNLLPACGEFVYDTTLQSSVQGEYVSNTWMEMGARTIINSNAGNGISDVTTSLEQMALHIPNAKWINITIAWFTDSLDIAACNIYPAVEYNSSKTTTPNNWMVGSITRNLAREISRDSNGRPLYGGTPSDDSVVRLLQDLKRRGYKVMIYPLLMVDAALKPWRGRITGNARDLNDFFVKYNSYIVHYAKLLGALADGMIIGSEMVGITSIRSEGVWIGTEKFIALAETIRAILGTDKTITYAANWSEYHSYEGNYHLDALWSSHFIDVVGIDAYFPLTDSPFKPTKQQIIDGWTSGEGWDYYYDSGKKIYYNSPNYAWKNIANWWSTDHINPNGAKTNWQPSMKPIWFTEFGFPSVDCCTNQPNVFYDPASIEGGFPKYSRGLIDNESQILAIEATLDYWSNSNMVTNMFLWAWDARPYPYFPDRVDVWSDGPAWVYGHWINGKVNVCKLSSVIKDIARDITVDTSAISTTIEGHIIYGRTLDSLRIIGICYLIDSYEKDNSIIFRPLLNSGSIININEEDLLPIESNSINALIIEEYMPGKIDNLTLNYINRTRHYGRDTINISNGNSSKSLNLNVPAVMSRSKAETQANLILAFIRTRNGKFKFKLPIKYITLEPLDVVFMNGMIMQIQCIQIGSGINVEAIPYTDLVPITNREVVVLESTSCLPICPISSIDPDIILTELPAISNVPSILITPLERYNSVPDMDILVSNDNGESFDHAVDIQESSTFGTVLEALDYATPCLMDHTNNIIVYMQSGALESVGLLGLYSGKNTAIVGQEIIQFCKAELLSSNKYKLSGLLRYKYNSPIVQHEKQEIFILLQKNNYIFNYNTGSINRKIVFRSAPNNSASCTVSGLFFKPSSPVNIVVDSGDKFIIKWIRRVRIDGAWLDFADIPLGEERELYEVEIYKIATHGISNIEILMRTMSSTATSCMYDYEDFISDFSDNNAYVTIKVYQVSSIVGRGYPGITTLFLEVKK